MEVLAHLISLIFSISRKLKKKLHLPLPCEGTVTLCWPGGRLDLTIAIFPKPLASLPFSLNPGGNISEVLEGTIRVGAEVWASAPISGIPLQSHTYIFLVIPVQAPSPAASGGCHGYHFHAAHQQGTAAPPLSAAPAKQHFSSNLLLPQPSPASPHLASTSKLFEMAGAGMQ